MNDSNKTFQGKENKAVAINSVAQKSNNIGESTFEDNRSEVVVQKKLQMIASNNANNNPAVQLKAAESSVNHQPAPTSENNTGLPDNLKSGVENLSGYSLDDVRVHRNSDKPAELNAHAYAQGTDIHLAPGQEKHLPHEAWHVAQQKQGRVKPTQQLKGKININDDAGLEKEADVMGAKALVETIQAKSISITNDATGNSAIVQRAENAQSEKSDDGAKSFEAKVEQDMLILRGDTTFIGWLQNSEFTQLHDAVNEYGTADPDNKQLLIQKIFDLGTSYLKNYKHDESNENHRLRKASIENIVARISQFDKDSKAASEALGIASTDDKVGIGAKLKKALFGEDTPFVQAVNAFTNYQNQSNALQTDDSEEGIKFLKEIFENASLAKVKIDEWKAIHAKNKPEDIKDKLNIIQSMESKMGIVSLNLRFKYKNLFKFNGERVDIDPLKKDFSIASIKIFLLEDVPGPLKNLEAEAKGITYKEQAFDFKEISLVKPPSEYEPLPGFKFTTPGKIVLVKSGTEYTLDIAESGIYLKAGSLFEGDAKAKGVFKYNSGEGSKVKLVDTINISTIFIKLLEDVPFPLKNLAAAAEGVLIKAQSDSYDVDFSKIAVTSTPEKFEPISGLAFTSPASVELIKTGSGHYTTIVGNSAVDVSSEGWFNASAKGSGEFDYQSGEAGKLKTNIKIPTAKAEIGEKAPYFLIGITGEAEDLIILSGFDEKDGLKNGIDWKKITVSSPPKVANPFNGPVSVTAPNKAEILGPKKQYKTTFTGANASANIGEKISAKGSADFFIDKVGNKGITEAELKVKAKTPKIPEEIIPVWPLKFSMSILFPPTPLNANIELGFGGGTQAQLDGSINYKGDPEKDKTVNFNITAGLEGDVHVSIKVGAGVGHRWILYAGIFAKALAEAKAYGEATLLGYFEHEKNAYSLNQANVKYDINAMLIAQVSAGAEAKAFLLEKTLYEVKSAEWKIGETSRDGAYDLINKKEEGTKGKGLLMGSTEEVPKEINADNKGTINNKLEGLSGDRLDWPEVRITKDLINKIIEFADVTKDNDPGEIKGQIDSLNKSLNNMDLRLEKLMPAKFNVFAGDKKKDILNARQLMGEIIHGHLLNFSQFITDKDVTKIESVENLTGSLLEVVRVVSKYEINNS